MANKFIDVKSTGSDYLLMNDGRFRQESSVGDLDNVLYSCVKHVAGASNTPYSGTTSGQLLCAFAANGYYGYQIYKPNTSKDLYMRYRQNGTYYSWRKLTDSYIAGDVVTLESSRYIEVAGHVGTGTNPYIYFTIPLDRPVYSASGVTFTSLQIIVRGINGNIIGATTDVISDSTYTVVAYLVKGISAITVRIAGATTGITQRTPAVVEVSAGTSFTFS